MKKVLNIVICIICITTIIVITPIKSNKAMIYSTDPEEKIVLNQDNGVYTALSVYGKNYEENDIIYINNYPQDTQFGNDKWLTCYIKLPNLNEVEELKIQVKKEKQLYNSNIIKKEVQH